MALLLDRIDVYNDGADGAAYQLVIKVGDEVVGATRDAKPSELISLFNARILLGETVTLTVSRKDIYPCRKSARDRRE